MKRIALIVILLYSYLGYSQKEGNNWVFAEKAGITFNYGKPVTIQKSEITYGGSAVISTPNGRLLYYSDGVNLFDSFHNSLGVTLKGTQGGLQNAMFVPRPDSANRIFIFTTKTVNGFNYSEIDTRLRSGRGDIVSDKLNIKLLYPSCGKITAVKHANRKDFWVVTHKYNSDSIYAYRIKSSGVDTIPVISKTGLKITDAQGQNYVMKVSPDGKKICSLNAYDSSILADFDAATGRVSNVWRFMNNEIGVEFSAKSKFLYTIGNDRLNQYNLSAKNNKTFINSRITIDTIYSNGPGLLQLGPDGKIYITIFVHNYLHAILFPDFDGERCIPQRNYVYLDGKLSSLGLPDMVQSFFQKKTFAVIPNCGRDTVFFKISNTYNLDSAKWDFGDTASGALNYSTNTSNVFHLYKSPGDYTSKLISYHKEFRDTIYETVTVNYGKPFLGNDAIICNSKKLTLNPKGVYKKYLWTGGGTTKTLSVSKAGTYDVTVTDYDGCVSSDTIKIKSGSIKAGFSIADTSQCLKNNLFNFKETTKYTNDKQAKSNWVFSDSTSKTDSIVSKSFIKPGVYAVKLVSESQLGCMDSISKTVSIYPQTKIDFSINQATQCFNTHSFDFKITKDTGKIMYSWDLGDVQIPNSGDVNGKKYGKEGIYKISLMSETDKNCKDTLTKSITILSSPKADFSWDLACSRTATNFSFTGTRPTEPIVTIVNWNFNNESTSTLENPSKLFGSAGSKKINIVVYSNNGCMDTLTKTMEIKPQSKAGFEAEDVCESDSVVFMNKSQDASSYNWRFGDGQTSNLQYPKHKYQIPSTTTFNVTLVALVIDGCSDSVIKAVTINTNPKSDFTYIANYNKVDFKATQNGHTTYKWILGNGDSATSTNKDYSYTYSISGKYIACLKVINTAACFSKTCQEVLVAVGINDLNKLKGFKLYPNPNRGHFTLEIEDPSKDVSIAIYDALGNLVKKVIKNNSDKYYTIDANLAGGIYNLRIEQNREIRTIRLIIK